MTDLEKAMHRIQKAKGLIEKFKRDYPAYSPTLNDILGDMTEHIDMLDVINEKEKEKAKK